MNIKVISSFILILFLYSCGGGGGGGSDQLQLDINYPPTISGTISDIRVGETFSFTPTTFDSNGDTLTFSISEKPDWLSFDLSTGSLNGTAPEESLGSSYTFTITVTDGENQASLGPLSFSVTPPIFFISFDLENMDEYRNMDFELAACFVTEDNDECLDSEEIITIDSNGVHLYKDGIETGFSFEVKVDRDPARQECSLDLSEGVIEAKDIVIKVDCQQDESAGLFLLDRMHKIRLTMSIDEWQRFVLDTERANYKTGDANGNVTEWNTWSHSEVYRQVDFEYLDASGNVIEALNNVGFKMKGNTSRQWPEEYNDSDGNWDPRPRRFSFSLKFDEKFDEDEGVYSCIDNSGFPAAVEGHPCWSRVGKDLAEVPENDDREFMGLEKIFFRYNRDDPSYQRELLAHDILNSYGIPLSRVAHANIELVINGDGDYFGKTLPITYNMGVFQMVEQVDKPFLKRFFGKNGFLFKIGGGDLAGSEEINPLCVFYEESDKYIDKDFCQIGVEKSDPESREEWLGSANYLNPSFVNSDINDGGEESQFKPYKPNYDLKSKKKSIDEGRMLLQDFIRFVQTNPSASSLSDQFDVDGFIKAQAAEIVIGAVDHYVRVANNYYLYFNPLTEKWIYMPNDFDFTFRDHHPLAWGTPEWAAAFRDITGTFAFPANNKVDWASRELGDVSPVLWEIVFSDDSNKDLLYEHVRFIIDNYLQWSEVSQSLYSRNNLVRDTINQTEAALPGGCEVTYNPQAIDAIDSSNLCDDKDISISKFIELRIKALDEELSDNGF
ncbi:MAG: CotH kinase family protein [Candidatus Neomarinimicrobiota bacterium]